MKILVLGATGRVGCHVVTQALDAGHTVTAFARTPGKLSETGVPTDHGQLRVVEGDVQEATQVAAAVEGQDAVISAVGLTKTSREDVLTATARHVIAAMEEHGVRRLVSLVGAGVPDPHDTATLGRRVMRGVMKLVAGAMLADAERHAELVRVTDLDWTLVRPPRLTDAEPRGTYRTGYLTLGPSASIARPDLVRFLLELAAEGGWEHEAPMVSY